jgi:hypothetical protein
MESSLSTAFECATLPEAAPNRSQAAVELMMELSERRLPLRWIWPRATMTKARSKADVRHGYKRRSMMVFGRWRIGQRDSNRRKLWTRQVPLHVMQWNSTADPTHRNKVFVKTPLFGVACGEQIIPTVWRRWLRATERWIWGYFIKMHRRLTIFYIRLSFRRERESTISIIILAVENGALSPWS